MSVSILSAVMYSKVANSISSNFHFILEEFKEKHNLKCNWKLILQKMEVLRKANYNSYNQRYEEYVAMENVIYDSNVKYGNYCDFLKALQCIRYQIEIENFDYTFIDELINVVKDIIIWDLPEYQAAKWME